MRSLFLLSLLLFATPSAAQDWTPIDLGTTEDILHVEAPNTAWAWVAGTGGLVVQSDYARMVWNTIDVGAGADQLSVIESAAGQVWTGGGNCNPVSVAEAAPAGSRYLDIAPNPPHRIGRVAFGGPRTGAYSLELYDVNGRRVQPLTDGSWAAGNERSAVLDVSGLPAGIYFLRLDTGGAVTSQRLTVVR